MKVSRSIIWNTVGTALPLLVGIAVVPTIVRQLGVERFGFLSVIWVMIGYFSIFDLGLGRTLTKLVADRTGTGREPEIPGLVSTTVILVVGFSVAASIAMGLSARWLAQHVLHASPDLIGETSAAVVWLSISLPFVLLATVLVGMLEGFHKFALLSVIRMPMGILIFVAPLAVFPFTNSLAVITAALATLRAVNAAVLSYVALNTLPALRQHFEFRRDRVRPLLTFGGWLTVSNIVNPLLVYFDRFVIASMLGGGAIAFYTVPYDILTRLWVFPTAIQGVLFPTFAALHSQASARILPVFKRSSETTLLLMLPALIAVLLLAPEGLNLWLGSAFAQGSAAVAKVLMVGVLVNSMARGPFALVQGAGFARWTALLHLCELAPYGICLWLLLSRAGIEGAAYSWTGRVIVDTIALYAMAVRIESRLLPTAVRDAFWVTAACAVTLLFSWLAQGLPIRIITALLAAGLCGLLLLRYLNAATVLATVRTPGPHGTAGEP